MARPTRDVEIIEVLDPDDPTIDWHVAASPPPPPPPAGPTPGRRRWPWVAFALVVVASVVAVVITAVTDDTGEPVLAEGKYLVDDVAVRSYSADIVTPPDGNGYYAMLAQGGPLDGWVSVEATRSTELPIFRDSYIDTVEGAPMVISADDPLRTATVIDRFVGWTLVVRSAGLPLREVSNFTRAVQVNTALAGPQVTWGVPGAGRTIVATGHSRDEAMYGRVITRMTYLDERQEVVTLRVADGDLERQLRTLSYMSIRSPETIDGRSVVTLAETGESVVMWEQDGHLLSLAGVADRPTLTALSRQVRQATDDEWHTRLIFLRPDYRVGDFATVSSGSDWVAGVQRAERGGRDLFLWWFSVPGDGFTSMSVPVRFEPTTMPFADRVVVGDVTYVFVSMPGTTGVTTASVYAGEGPPAELTLRQAFPDVDVVVGVHRVDSPGQVRVFTPGLQSLQGGLLPDPLK
jgi:hypothetical protein